MVSPTTFIPKVLVSWDGSGAFTGPDDDVTPYVVADPGIAIDDGLDGARTLNRPKVGAVDVVLFNHTGRFSQERADSPLAQRILPGRPVVVTARHGTSRAYDSPTAYDAAVFYDGLTTYPLARTYLDQIEQATGLGQQTVTFRTLGTEQLLLSTTVSVPVTASVRVDQAITRVLDAAGWPSDLRSIDVSDTLLSWFWVDERPPWEVLRDLLAAEGPGLIDIDRTGVFIFENRHHRTTAARSTAPQATLYDRRVSPGGIYDAPIAYETKRAYDGGAAATYFTQLGYTPGWEGIYNRATYLTRRRATGALGVVWTYGAPLALNAGETRTLIARPTLPYINAVTPALGTDYAVAGGTVSVTISSSSGLVAFITVTALTGAPTISGVGASTGLALRAQPLTVVSETTVTNAIDASSSIATYSPIPGQAIPRVLAVNGWPEVEPIVASSVCDAWVSRYMQVRPTVTIEVRNADAEHLRLILATRVSDRLTIIEANTGLADDVWVNATRLAIAAPGGVDVRAVFGCEKVEEVSGFTWDGPISTWDSAVWAW